MVTSSDIIIDSLRLKHSANLLHQDGIGVVWVKRCYVLCTEATKAVLTLADNVSHLSLQEADLEDL